jgi:hypothetical protein
MVVQITKLHLQNALTFILKAGIVKGVLAGRLFILAIEEKKKWQS